MRAGRGFSGAGNGSCATSPLFVTESDFRSVLTGQLPATPDHAATVFGCLELACALQAGVAVRLVHFVEQPDAARATTMFEAGNFRWNAGIFLFRTAGLSPSMTTGRR
ncbi:sugar phosphate nucleotidyltransferase [Gemmobacter sp. 24YEA27]|uniref:sugar phosphate nucleotidyltransferase n=1 Tax=Gemmobacter sp. 24YEA27 TaxID=3040672 RepID=UPI0032C4A161